MTLYKAEFGHSGMELISKARRRLKTTFHMLSHSRHLRRALGRPYITAHKWIWNHLPPFATCSRAGWIYGSHLQWLIQLQATRRQYTGTFFFRNRCELELLIRLLNTDSATLNLTILGCSKGAEVYSYFYTIRHARPDLKINLHALDIEPDVLEFAQEGVYSLESCRPHVTSSSDSFSASETLTLRTFGDQRTSVFERMTSDEIIEMFECESERARIKPQFRNGITWKIGDAGDPRLMDSLSPQDIVVANRFLCHMRSEQAEACLRNLACLVKPGGYLFVSGIDLAVRSKVARELRWRPVIELIDEIHEGDQSLRRDWPLEYWGLEPLDRRRDDWETRYASVFQIDVAFPVNADEEI
jgi:chemotaxis methyl-accepting protein methylase